MVEGNGRDDEVFLMGPALRGLCRNKKAGISCGIIPALSLLIILIEDKFSDYGLIPRLEANASNEAT